MGAAGGKPAVQRHGSPAAPSAGRVSRPDRPERRLPPVPTAAMTGSTGDWRAAVRSTVQGLHYDLVDLERGLRGLLRVTIDRRRGHSYASPGAAVTVDDCETVTRQLQYVLEVEGLDYGRLEVSSPGLDRPLRGEADYERYCGQAVSVTLKVPFQGRKVYQGLLARAEGAKTLAGTEGAHPPVGAEGAHAPERAEGAHAPERAEGAHAPERVEGAHAPERAEGAHAPSWQITFKDGKAEHVLSFALDEVREARLVPVVDFKGLKSHSDPAAATKEAPAASEVDGGSS